MALSRHSRRIIIPKIIEPRILPPIGQHWSVALHMGTVIERIGTLPTGPDTTFAHALAR